MADRMMSIGGGGAPCWLPRSTVRRAMAACLRVMVNVCYTVSYRSFSD
jgi:hypothetical protein